MKQIYHILIIFSAILLAASCEYDFKLRNMPSDPVLHVECAPGMSDTTEVTVRLADPAGGVALRLNMTKAVPTLLINGIETALTLRKEEDTSVAVFFTEADIRTGDRLSLTVSLDGVKTITSETTVPASIPDFSVTLEKIERDLIARISIKDNPATEDFYAVRLIKKWFVRDSGGERERLFYNRFKLPDSKEHPELVNGGVMQYDDTDSFFIVDDTAAKDGECILNFMGSYESDLDETYLEGNLGYWHYYKVICYRLSPEYYYYYRSRYEVDNNQLSGLGWAPANFAYTNISNGLGVFGAVTGADTGWLSNSEVVESNH